MDLVRELLETAGDARMRHAALVHLPAALAVLAAPAALALAWRGGQAGALRRIVIVAYGTLVVASLGAAWSGSDALQGIGAAPGEAREVLRRHEWMGTRVWGLALAMTAISAATAARVPLVAVAARAACALGALACAVWVSVVGHLGGTAVYRHGVAVEPRTGPADVEGAVARLRAADPRQEFFAERIRPLLARACMGCHGPGDFSAGGLDLTTMRGVLAGGERAPAVVPGRPAASLLLAAVDLSHPSLRMPPDGSPLTAEEVRDLRAWIEQGAVWAP